MTDENNQCARRALLTTSRMDKAGERTSGIKGALMRV